VSRMSNPAREALTRSVNRRDARDFHPLAGILPADTRKRGTCVQVYAFADRQCTWAGVHYVPEISARAAYRLEHHWRRWRRWYDNLPNNRARNYPAKEGPRESNLLQIFPVGTPRDSHVYRIPAQEDSRV
jgi:hypothetical protein